MTNELSEAVYFFKFKNINKGHAIRLNAFIVSGILHTEGNDPPQSFLSFTVSKFTNVYQVGGNIVLLFKFLLLIVDFVQYKAANMNSYYFLHEFQDDDYSAVLKYKLLLPDPTTSSIYMYDTSSVICLSGTY